MSTEIDAEASAILTTWFGSDTLDGPIDPEFQRRWFAVDPAFDRELGERFGALVESAAAGRLLSWEDSARGALALVLLLDQFTRNIFRNTPRAFVGDARALQIAEALVAAGRDKNLTPWQRWFAYLPFEHSESLLDQERSVALFSALAREMQNEAFDSAHDYALRHREAIERFGRFPHRNAILDRDSTAEEVEFLKQPGSSF